MCPNHCNAVLCLSLNLLILLLLNLFFSCRFTYFRQETSLRVRGQYMRLRRSVKGLFHFLSGTLQTGAYCCPKASRSAVLVKKTPSYHVYCDKRKRCSRVVLPLLSCFLHIEAKESQSPQIRIGSFVLENTQLERPLNCNKSISELYNLHIVYYCIILFNSVLPSFVHHYHIVFFPPGTRFTKETEIGLRIVREIPLKHFTPK